MTTTAPVATEKHTDSWYHEFVPSRAAHVFGGLTRILLGLVFLWAFLDKTFGWGWATPAKEAWKLGAGHGSPTYGFLVYGTSPHSPLHSFYTNIASTSPNAWVNWLFMLGLLGIGVALTFGVFMRIGTISAVVMLAMMWLAEWPVQQLHDQTGAAVYNAPFLDYHILYGVTILTLMFLGAERWLGLGKWWESLSFVKKLPWLA